MDFSDIEQAGWQVADFVRAYVEPVLFGAGAVGALIAVVLAWRFLRTGELHAKLGTLAVTLATAFAMEGMFEVAHGPLGLNVAGSLMFCATFEIVMLHQGTLAAHKLSAKRPVGHPAPDISRHMAFVWLVSVASGVIASTASNSITEVVLRLATPPLAAGIWYMSLYADRTPSGPSSNWIWTPQRVGVQLGLLRPGDADDLDEVYRRRRVDKMVRLAGRVSTGPKVLAGRRNLRLRRLAELADAAMLAEVRERYQRGATVQALIFDAPTDAPRGALPAQSSDAPVTHPVDAPVTHLPDAPLTHPGDAVRHPIRPAVTQVDAAPSRRVREVVMRRPVSVPPVDAAQRDAALRQAVDAVLTQQVAIRAAARDAAIPEATVRRAVDRAKAEMTHANGHQFETTGQTAG